MARRPAASPARIASAGGLEALEGFFQAVPTGTGCAFVVIQHSSPDGTSPMPNLLARRTRLPVQVAEDGMTLAADQIYLVPPRMSVGIEAGRLTLRPAAPREAPPRPINAFLHALAAHRGEPAIVIVLSGTAPAGSAEPAAPVAGEPSSTEVAWLRRELSVAQQSLRTLMQEVGSRNEELQTTYEELVAANAELVGANEELQSVNQGLATVNAELQHKIADLQQLSGDMDNLLASIEIGTLFVDVAGRIRKFTPAATQFFNLIDRDIGRPLADITHRLEIADLARLTERVVATGETLEREVQDRAGRWFLLRILPYRIGTSRIEGIVLTFVDISALKQAQLEAERLRALYQPIVEKQTELICRFLPDTTLTFVNDAYCRYFGRAPEELLGSRFIELVPEERRGGLLARLAQLPRVGQFVHEHEVVDAAGNLRWQQWTNTVLRHADGEMPEFQSVGRDVTERRQFELALQESERRFREVADGAPVLIWMAEALDLGFDYVNRLWLEFTGHGLEEELRLGWSAGVHPEDLPRCLATFRDAAARRAPFSMEYRRLAHDGRYRWLVSNGRPRFGSDGSVLGYIASCTDITEQREILAHLHSVIETAPDGVVIIDGAGTVQTYNAASRRMFGYEPEEVIGQNVKMLMPTPFCDEHDEYLRAYHQTGRRQIIGKGRKVEGLRKDGSTFPLRLSVGESVRGGAPIFVGILQDLSEREQREEALRRIEDDLRQHQMRLEDFLAIASDWLWETDEEHRFVYVSEGEKQSDAINAWMLGKTRWELADADPTTDEPWRAHLADLEARRPFRDFTFWFTGPDGMIHRRSANGRPVFGQEGRFLGYRGTDSVSSDSS